MPTNTEMQRSNPRPRRANAGVSRSRDIDDAPPAAARSAKRSRVTDKAPPAAARGTKRSRDIDDAPPAAACSAKRSRDIDDAPPAAVCSAKRSRGADKAPPAAAPAAGLVACANTAPAAGLVACANTAPVAGLVACANTAPAAKRATAEIEAAIARVDAVRAAHLAPAADVVAVWHLWQEQKDSGQQHYEPGHDSALGRRCCDALVRFLAAQEVGAPGGGDAGAATGGDLWRKPTHSGQQHNAPDRDSRRCRDATVRLPVAWAAGAAGADDDDAAWTTITVAEQHRCDFAAATAGVPQDAPGNDSDDNNALLAAGIAASLQPDAGAALLLGFAAGAARGAAACGNESRSS